ncbi:transglutaminase-like domain-containing protein [Gracilinema caldarium]|uniref:Transglutaminase domain-containing protein n=1 Tax=Gracilinema caldarium (strain ATCC 51460 / DSM 7334 / H1) TaxID=744872 RepID=F8F398_GRAC1|nr:transglutaminase-like domain-containing protein [Gracilinema caldarium]AEJ20424.1 transglutaminase domain-containing protein [Gracilinema caldarium DSM 7334]
MPLNKPWLRSFLLRSLLLWIVLLLPALGPPILLAYFLHATGPLWIPLVWASVSIGLAVLMKTQNAAKRFIKITSFLWLGLGLLLIMVLLNVSRRSLAEVWFLMVRQGRGRGFFSYFASLVYGFMTVVSSMLILYYGFIAGTITLMMVSLLTWAILFSQTTGFVGALGMGIVLFIVMNIQRFRLKTIRHLLSLAGSVCFPFGIVVLCLAPLVPIFETQGTDISLPGIDVTPLALQLAPTLPLLMDVPGYGFDVGVSRFSNRLDLTSAPMFEIEGPPDQVIYLASATYQLRTADGWAEDTYIQDPRLMNGAALTEPLPVLRLRFVGEYYDRFPLPSNASRFMVQAASPKTPLLSITIATLQSGIRFDSPIEQGTLVEVALSKTETYPETAIELGIQGGDPVWYLNPGPDPSGCIARLAKEWRPGTIDTTTILAVAKAVEMYLKKQYGYSKKVQGGPRSLALERFLFEEKQGYCLHFASAFVVLLRQLGIPARIVEGFRVQLDGRGRDLIRGTDAHAWAEIYIGGVWLRFDPTPGSSLIEPSPYRIPAALAPSRPAEPAVTTGAVANRSFADTDRFWQIVLIVPVTVLILLVLYQIYCRGDRRRYVRTRLRRRVLQAKRRGIPGPELTGWLQWQQRVLSVSEGQKVRDLEQLVQEHLEYHFGPNLSSRKH